MEQDNDQQLKETVHDLVNLINSGQDDEFMNRFTNLHDFEKGQVYAAMPENIREVAWRIMDDETLATIFDNLEVDPEEIVELLEEMPAQKGADILVAMFADNEADLLQAMPARKVANYLALMPADEVKEVKQLINYDDETAGALMATEYLAVKKSEKVKDVLIQVKKQAEEAESIIYVYVVDEEHRLIGVVSLRDLLTHPDDMTIDSITNTRVISVKADSDQKDVAQVVADYNFFSVPVIDDEKHLLGIITVDDIVDVIDEEAVGDYSGLAAVDVSDTDDSAWHSAVKRIPWLLTLLVLGLASTVLVGLFEHTIRQAPILAAFITIIAGTAGNAGTQSLALAIRHFGNGSDRSGFKNLLSEFISAIVLAVIGGVVLYAVTLFWQGNQSLAMAVGLSLALSILASSVLAHLVPALLNRVNVDPAIVNGPLVATVCDWASILIYFSIATAMLSQFVGK
ncbi:Mg/Co/Ni transporter MgtE (contains CBS domain) (MgtE) [Fructobacillus fructosus]|uniref:Magnesium transporter MgtE n=1 Tax=Fructobacillus fructosus TaxID=1631 RepID=A0ABM9MV20_9LACO|nr:magnesium transporter [Fructobacillus fructosus]KRN52534.1 magnesium transporter [Fructobacillus fructosus KCTC 3544]GAP01258.1 magnesium transporter [Fructobacillus fructosus]CAK1230427.1 Mg/Co/Ni transporter MgtE (contains CBS domain) (MgtE) [Fructobacillus fructosus]CAK1242313.1 Mg/Co/Ni transporter MgtE (contains CBS domain) (MgtE) [Fructobacillus fructosus]